MTVLRKKTWSAVQNVKGREGSDGKWSWAERFRIVFWRRMSLCKVNICNGQISVLWSTLNFLLENWFPSLTAETLLNSLSARWQEAMWVQVF